MICNYNANELFVTYCCSNLFAEVVSVSIISLFENNRDFSKITIFIFDDNISDKNKHRLNLIASQYDRVIIYIPLPNPSQYYSDDRFTIKSLGHTYARLIIGDVLRSINRVLALDSDTIVLGSLKELWTTDLNGCYMAGVDDCMGAETMEIILHKSKDSHHVNAGMFLMDLEQWRSNNLGEVFSSYMKNAFDSGKGLSFYEEEVINNTIIDKIKIISPKYDFMTVDAVFSYEEVLKFRKPAHYYSKETMIEAKNNPVIIHATTLFYIRKRIFEKGSRHPYKKEFEFYRSMTPWKDIPCKISQRSKFNDFIKILWHCMPKRMAIALGSFVRNKIRPMLSKKRDDE